MTGQYYRGYFTRDGEDYEVTAELYDYGRANEGYDNLGGHWVEITEDPLFSNFVCEDENGEPVTMTNKEKEIVVKQMIEHYWDTVFDGADLYACY